MAGTYFGEPFSDVNLDYVLVNDVSVKIKPTNRAQQLINLEIPVLVRSLKSSNVELG